MFGFIRGTIDEITEDSLIIDNNGIGWKICVPGNLLDGRIRTGDEIKLYTHMSVSENAVALYGFFSRDDLEIFRMLINVSGIGPKGAVGVLSALSADDLRFAVLSVVVSAISKAPGIGKKTAQKVILELKDKFRLDEALERKLAHDQAEAVPAGAALQNETDAVEALVALGYSGTEALQAVRKVHAGPEMTSEDILKAALRFIF